MELFTTKTLITVAVFLALYAIFQRYVRKKNNSQEKINKEYLDILNSEQYKVK